MMTNVDIAGSSDPFFREYTSQAAILKYTKATAGYGISYLLDHDYKEIYLEGLNALSPEVKRRGIRMLEFGCGGGMNIVHLMSVLSQTDIKVEAAVGTDFSPVLIEGARREAKNYLADKERKKLSFHVALNETIVSDLAEGMKTDPAKLANSFHFLFGVNTFRYCHRANKEMECAQDLFKLLAPGGVCVNIDMNDKFPFFRSNVKRKFGADRVAAEECYIPSLAEYTEPFKRAGFEILRSDNVVWIPHSSGKPMAHLLAALSPILSTVASSRATRSLVIARKPLA